MLGSDKARLTFDLSRTCLDRSCHGGDTVDSSPSVGAVVPPKLSALIASSEE